MCINIIGAKSGKRKKKRAQYIKILHHRTRRKIIIPLYECDGNYFTYLIMIIRYIHSPASLINCTPSSASPQLIYILFTYDKHASFNFARFAHTATKQRSKMRRIFPTPALSLSKVVQMKSPANEKAQYRIT